MNCNFALLKKRGIEYLSVLLTFLMREDFCPIDLDYHQSKITALSRLSPPSLPLQTRTISKPFLNVSNSFPNLHKPLQTHNIRRTRASRFHTKSTETALHLSMSLWRHVCNHNQATERRREYRNLSKL